MPGVNRYFRLAMVCFNHFVRQTHLMCNRKCSECRNSIDDCWADRFILGHTVGSEEMRAGCGRRWMRSKHALRRRSSDLLDDWEAFCAKIWSSCHYRETFLFTIAQNLFKPVQPCFELLSGGSSHTTTLFFTSFLWAAACLSVAH